MGVSDSYLEHIRELLAEVPELRTRRMFGGAGLYSGERMFALIADDVLYLKADARTQAQFALVGGQPFRYVSRGRTVTTGFWTVPDHALATPAELARWAGLALQAADRAKRR